MPPPVPGFSRLEAGGLDPKTVDRLVKKAFKGAKFGQGTTPRGGKGAFSRSSFNNRCIQNAKQLKTFQKGLSVGSSVSMALATAPYDIYLEDAAEEGFKLAEEVGLKSAITIHVANLTSAGRAPRRFIYQFDGTRYLVFIVRRKAGIRDWKNYITVRNYLTNEVIIKDDLSIEAQGSDSDFYTP